MPPASRARRSSSRGRSPGPAAVIREHELPTEHANELLSNFSGKLHRIRSQPLTLEEGEIITIARIRVPTPKGVSGHLIKRFDTDAMSASSLFRVAFPLANDQAELDEMTYLSKRYNTKQAGDEDENGSGKLNGTWIPLEDAKSLAKEYGLLKFAQELITYELPSSGADIGSTASSPAAPTPRRRASKSPAPPSAATRSKRQRVASPPAITRSQSSAMQSLSALATPSKPTASDIDTEGEGDEVNLATSDDHQDQPAKRAGGVQVTQEIIADNDAGTVVEETTVTFSGKDQDTVAGSEGLIGSEAQAREAAEDARKLIQSLKEDGVLQGESGKRAREIEDESEAEAELDGTGEDIEQGQQPGLLKRWFGKKRAPRTIKKSQSEIGPLQLMQSPDGAQVLVARTTPPAQNHTERRRYIAMAGMVVMGAATAAAPYLFG